MGGQDFGAAVWVFFYSYLTENPENITLELFSSDLFCPLILHVVLREGGRLAKKKKSVSQYIDNLQSLISCWEQGKVDDVSVVFTDSSRKSL